MKRWTGWFAVAWAMLGCVERPASTPDPVEPVQPIIEPAVELEPPPVWLGLERGPHAVGYRQALVYDPTRRLRNPLTPLPERPILINRWYPAEPSGAGAMTVADYLVVADESRFAELLGHHVREVFAAELLSTFGAGFANAQQRAWLAAALAEPVFARRDARPREGAWPVVIYHPGLGGAFADNFVLFELLASHGFLVVSSAFVPGQSSESSGFGIGWDPSTSIADLDHIVRVLSESGELGIDTKVAVMGHSYGAQAAWIYAMEGRRIDAVVSIDSTIENSDPADPWFRAGIHGPWLDRTERVRVPSLVLASQQATDKSFWDRLTGSDSWFAIVPVLDHGDFVSHGGVLRTLHGHEFRGAEAGQAEAFVAAHTWELRTIHGFLAGVLRDDAARLVGLDDAWASELAGASLEHRVAVRSASLADQLAILEAEGMAGIVALCEPAGAKRACSSEEVLHELARTRLRAAEPDRAVALLREVVARYPSSAASHDLLGEALLYVGDATAAVAEFEQALALTVASDESGAWFYRVRATIARNIADPPGIRYPM